MNSKPDSVRGAAQETRVLTGLAVSQGCASGPVYLFHTAVNEQVPDYLIEPVQIDRELARLVDAFSLTRSQICSLAVELKKRTSGDEVSIFDGHLMLLDDPSFIGSCKEKITKGLCNAEAAVRRVAEKYSAIFAAMDDDYLRERGQDIDDIAKRIIRNLLGGGSTLAACVTQPCILVADELSPSETIALPKHLILGFAIDCGSKTSHSSLLARALGIPAVVGIGSLSGLVKTGDRLLLDGIHGKVTLHPGPAEEAAFERMAGYFRSMEASFAQIKAMPGRTLDGRSVPFLANVDTSTAMTDLYAVGAEGIGLYRTEYLWLRDDREPSEEEQTHAYTAAVRAIPEGQSVTIRVLDLGGDKMPKSGGPAHKDANPFLGNRSIRYLLRNPNVFRRQLRAVLRASAHGNVRVMYPMISTIDELRAAKAEMDGCMAALRAEGVPFDETIKHGVMIEIPAAALIADALAQECDFFSIGTNDLIQYTLAVDRVNETVAQLYQPTHPAVLQLIALTVQAAHAHGLRVSVCGETAADPVMAVLFVGMGVDELSMSPNLIKMVKKTISLVSFADARALSEMVCAMKGTPADQVYAFCRGEVIKLSPDLKDLE
jgi:phosphotransferase system enzyme I (PtsI)